MKIAQIQGLTKKFNSYTLGVDNVNFIVNSGEILGIVGSSLSGKTTIAKCLAGLIKPTNGSINVLGHDAVKDAAYMSNVGYLGSEVSYFPNKTVLENLQFIANIYGTKIDRLEKLTADLGLNLTRKAKHLSKCNLRKLGIAMVLLRNSKLVVLDNPFDDLDEQSKVKVFALLQQEISKTSSAIVTSDNLDDLRHICNRVIVLKEGKIIANETSKTLQQKQLKKVTVYTKNKIKLKFDGITDLRSDGKRTTFYYSGDVTALINYLTNNEMQDINIVDAEFETFFKHYYE